MARSRKVQVQAFTYTDNNIYRILLSAILVVTVHSHNNNINFSLAIWYQAILFLLYILITIQLYLEYQYDNTVNYNTCTRVGEIR